MLRGDASHHSPEEPGASPETDIAAGRGGQDGSSRPTAGPPAGRAGHPGRPRAEQQEILAQFEAAIAGMHTREIQIGLRQLLAGLDASSRAGTPGAPEISRNGGISGAADLRGAVGAEEVTGAGAAGEVTGAGAAGAGAAGAGAAGAGAAGAGAAGARELAEEPGELGVDAALGVERPGIDLDEVPRAVAELVLAVRTPSARRQLERLVSEAELQRPVTIDPDTAARMVRPYTWLLGRVGHEGIRLTDAGHLPPGDVAAVIETLGLGSGAPIKRENQAPAVVQLRESAQATGLVRKQRGRLLRTTAGDELHDDPTGLWWHLAARIPLRSAAVSEVEPGLVLLACVAARFTQTLDLTIARMLTAMGWVHRDGGPLTGPGAAQTAGGTHAVLRRLGALPDDRRPGHTPWPTPEGVTFARAALRTWPTPD